MPSVSISAIIIIYFFIFYLKSLEAIGDADIHGDEALFHLVGISPVSIHEINISSWPECVICRAGVDFVIIIAIREEI